MGRLSACNSPSISLARPLLGPVPPLQSIPLPLAGLGCGSVLVHEVRGPSVLGVQDLLPSLTKRVVAQGGHPFALCFLLWVMLCEDPTLRGDVAFSQSREGVQGSQSL